MRKRAMISSVLAVWAILVLPVILFSGASTALSSSILASEEDMPEVIISITLQGEDMPTYHLITNDALHEQPLSVTPMIRHFPGQLDVSVGVTHSMPVETASTNANLVDHWNRLLAEDFEGSFPQNPCAVYDGSDDGFNRSWGRNNLRSASGLWAGWPASAGADNVNPAMSHYPANLDSWLICGPFDMRAGQDLMTQFARWMEINDVDDYFFVGASVDAVTFHGLAWSGVDDWAAYHVWFQNVAGEEQVWVGWLFHSDADENRAAGVWLDDVEIWRYNTPAQVCGGLDPGYKGVVVNPYEWINNSELPSIRAGDTIVVDKLKAAGAHWVRLVFRQRAGIVRQREYDRIIDTLCANGISVLGVVNHETLTRQDYNNAATAVEYRQAFAAAASFIAKRFGNRITYWEVWNEQNLRNEGPFVDPVRYAPLLIEAAQAIKTANPQAQILFGGLASAWGDSHDYFVEVYSWLGTARPFDYFAVHPYARVDEGPNPQVYMYADQPFYNTIVDKFMRTMAENNDGHKRVWITEIGWNSSKGSPTRPTCLEPVLVYESEQAAYLKMMFDILRNEVPLWNNPGTPAIEKIVWYQYMDTGVADPCTLSQTTWGHIYVPSSEMVTAGAVDWWFGLYRGDKVTPKETWCAYRAYPLTCEEFFSQRVYIPLVVRNR